MTYLLFGLIRFIWLIGLVNSANSARVGFVTVACRMIGKKAGRSA